LSNYVAVSIQYSLHKVTTFEEAGI